MLIFEKVKVGSKEYTQPISKLSPVEFDEHHELMSHMNESSQ